MSILTNNPDFEQLFILIVIINLFFLSMEGLYDDLLEKSNIFFTTIFTIELLMKFTGIGIKSKYHLNFFIINFH